MIKYYVPDTNVLINDPHCIEKFIDKDSTDKPNKVIILETVIKELTKNKSGAGQLGMHCRMALRTIKEYVDKNLVAYSDRYFGYDRDKNIILYDEYVTLDINPENLYLAREVGDEYILKGFKELVNNRSESEKLIFVTMDAALYIKFKSKNYNVEEYITYKASDEVIYGNTPNISKMSDVDKEETIKKHLNSYYIDRGELYINRNGKSEKVYNMKDKYYGISAKNLEQKAIINAIEDPSVSIISIIGKTGSGKSLLTLATALEYVLESNEYDSIEFYKDYLPLSRDIGYLPFDGAIL